MKNILFAASECAPYAKSGGLGDIIGSLPQALIQHGMKVTVILPLYQKIRQSALFSEMTEIMHFNTKVSWRNHETRIYLYHDKQVRYLFVENDYYFMRPDLYGYFDDAERFIYFSEAITEYLYRTEDDYDVLHCHDWQTGSLVANAKILRPQNFKIVFSIHNIQYQGLFYQSDYDNLINLDREHFSGFEWNGYMNLMKAALFHADVITTVSETYAEELLTPFYGEGLEDLLYMRREKLYGVTNGLDLKDYDPNRDKAIYKRYKTSRKSKLKNKLWLQEQHGLKISEDIPMYGLVTRLVGQKGIDLIERVFREFLNHNHVQFVMVGSGEARYEEYFRQLERDFPDRVRVTIGFEEEYARQIYAASDFFIMPSLFEPCGLGQLISLRYLTMPIVRETGGLRDTVTAFNEHELTGNGFSFSQYNAYDFLYTLNYSYEVYQNRDFVRALFANMKQSELGWDVSAEKYIAIYNQG